MKRILIVLIACLLTAGTLFGCRTTDGENGPAAETTEQASEKPLKTPEPTAEPTAEPEKDPFMQIDEAEILDSRHDWEDGYTARFQTHMLDAALLTVHLENNADYSDDALRAYAKTLAADVLQLRERMGETTEKVTVYIAKRMLDDRPVLLGDHLFCTVDDMASGAYHEALCGACFGLTIPWKQVGLSEYAFGTADEDLLRTYYSNKAHMLAASCAAVYFLSEVADAETIAAARKTAESITAFLIENEGFEAFLAAGSIEEILPAWAVHLGIETPVLPEGSAYTAAMTAKSDHTYLATLQIDNIGFRIEKGSFAQTADELYRFLCRFYYGAELLIARIWAEVPQAGEIAAARFSEPITICLTAPGKGTGSWTWKNRIDLVNEGAVWHELTHMLLYTEQKDRSYAWQCEALAEHWSRSVVTDIYQGSEIESFDEWLLEKDDAEENRALYEGYWALFQQIRAEDPFSKPGIANYNASCRTNGILMFLFPDSPMMQDGSSVADAYGRTGGTREMDGNALSYPEAKVMFEYLIDVYGAEKVVMGYMDQASLEELYGKTYPELYADCLAYLKERYGALLQND